ncbi:MAG: MurR/RpiR family transcriptional regulator [Pseudomonadota bacterium]
MTARALAPEAIGPRIRMRIPQLTPLEARVVEVMIARKDLDTTTQLKGIAEDAGVSDAMVVKVAKKLGFSGFRELRAGLVDYRRAPTASLHSEIAPDDDMASIAAKVFRTSIQALEETMAILDVKALQRAADMLYDAHRIEMYGVGGSAQIGRDVAHKLLRIGRRAQLYDDAHMMLMSAATLGPDDVVVAFSHSGETTVVLESLERAAECGAGTIAVTNYPGSSIAQKAEVVLCSTAQGSPLLGENAAARVAQLILMDTVFVGIAQRDVAQAEQALDQTMGAVQGKRRRR